MIFAKFISAIVQLNKFNNMKNFIKQLSNKFKSIYLIWILFNFVLLMLGGGFFNSHPYGGILRFNNNFFPFGRYSELNNYDYTEFLIYI